MLISARFLTAGPCVDCAVYLSVPIRTRSFVPARTVSSLPFTALTFGLARHGILKQPFNLDSWGCFRESPTLSRGASAALALLQVRRKRTTFLITCPISKRATPMLIKITQLPWEASLRQPHFSRILPESFCPATSSPPFSLSLICCRCYC